MSHNKQLRESAEAATQDGWLPINTFDQETAPYGGLIKAPSLIDLDFNPEGISIGCRVHNATDAPIATVKWNGSHDFYGDREITDATHWKPFDFNISDPESLVVLDAMIADRDYFVDENDRLKEQIATLTAERDAMREALRDAINSFAEDAETLADRIREILETAKAGGTE